MRCSMRCTRKSSSSRYSQWLTMLQSLLQDSAHLLSTGPRCCTGHCTGELVHSISNGARRGKCARLSRWVLPLQGLIQKYKSARVFDFASEQIAERYDGRTSPGGPGREHALGWINIVAQPTEVAANHGGGVVQRGRGGLPGTVVQPVQEKGHTNSQTCHVGFFVVASIFGSYVGARVCLYVCVSQSANGPTNAPVSQRVDIDKLQQCTSAFQ